MKKVRVDSSSSAMKRELLRRMNPESRPHEHAEFSDGLLKGWAIDGTVNIDGSKVWKYKAPKGTRWESEVEARKLDGREKVWKLLQAEKKDMSMKVDDQIRRLVKKEEKRAAEATSSVIISFPDREAKRKSAHWQEAFAALDAKVDGTGGEPNSPISTKRRVTMKTRAASVIANGNNTQERVNGLSQDPIEDEEQIPLCDIPCVEEEKSAQLQRILLLDDWRQALEECVSDPICNTNKGKDAVSFFRNGLEHVKKLAPPDILSQIESFMMARREDGGFESKTPSRHKRKFTELLERSNQ